jgi:predicted MPP superfamily phosphohydrolase
LHDVEAENLPAPPPPPPPAHAIEPVPAKWVKFRCFRPRVGPWLMLDSLAGYEWNRIELTISDLPSALNGARIVHLTDLHLKRKWRPEHQDLIERLNQNPPELILITGDFVDDKRDYRTALPTLERLIGGLPGASQVFAILGNHDTDLLEPRLIAMGVPVIIHRRVDATVRGLPVEIIGLPGPDRMDLSDRFVSAMPLRRGGVPRIVLCHYPDLIGGLRRWSADLYLAGHTHGGQICLPNGWPPMTHDALPRRLCKGAHDVNGTCMVVGRGFGFTTMPVRLWCPAEIVEIELRGST